MYMPPYGSLDGGAEGLELPVELLFVLRLRIDEVDKKNPLQSITGVSHKVPLLRVFPHVPAEGAPIPHETREKLGPFEICPFKSSCIKPSGTQIVFLILLQ